MADLVLLDDDMPFEIATVSDVVDALPSGMSRIFLAFTVDGRTFYVSDQGFNLTYMGGTPRVYAVVTSWGPFRKFMSRDGRDRENEVDVDFDPQAVIVDSTGTTQRTFMQLLQEFQLRETAVSFYQWSENASTDFLLWTGFWQHFHSYRTEQGKPLVTVRFGAKEALVQNPISDVVTAADFPGAPPGSLGKMISRAYGTRRTERFPGEDALHGSAATVMFGSGSRFITGVVIDQNQTTLKRKVRFSKNDGVSASTRIVKATFSDSPTDESDLFIRIPSANALAIVDPASYTLTNDSTKTEVLIDGDPIVYIPLRIGSKGSMGHSGFDATLYYLADDDHTNYLQTTVSDYRIAFNVPSLDISGVSVIYVAAIVDFNTAGAGGNRDIEFGLWNDYNTGSASWWGNASKRTALAGLAPSGAHNYQYGAQYVPSDAGHNVGATAYAEFSQGRFVGRDTNNVETPIQFLFQVTSGSKDGVRLYGVACYAKARIALERSVLLNRVVRRERTYDVQGRFKGWRDVIEAVETSVPTLDTLSYEFLLSGRFQSDDGSGTYDTASSAIRRGSSVAHHLLERVFGESCNTVPGEVGNFVDAKTEETAGEKAIDPDFGPDEVVTLDDAIASLQAKHPIRLHKEDGVWSCVYEEMNPDPSRFYRSTSEIVRISAKQHLGEDSIKVEELPWERIRNEVVVNYGHSFGTNRPLGTVNVKNKLSQDLFGVRKIQNPVEAPWITAESLDPSVTNYPARFLGQYYTRVNGRPRLTVTCRLSIDFFDLKRGHVVEFDTDMEDIGITCPAYRCGYLDYAFQRTDAATTNQAMSDTPTLMPNGTVTSRTIFAASQQVSGITVVHNGVGTYTTVANGWKYFDGSSWVALTNVTRSDGGDPLAALKGAAGSYTVNWDRPSPWLWKKGAPAVTGVEVGYTYFFGMDYTGTNSGGAVVGTAKSTYLKRWYGRLFEAIEVTRKPGSEGDYPYVEAVFQEVM